MTPAEYVAQRTWATIGHALSLRARIGEETLTDLLVLDMLPKQRAKGFWVSATTKPAEFRCGADLLVLIRQAAGWALFALQAKKLYPNDRYGALHSGRNGIAQLDTLERFARQSHAVPLYLLYNHSKAATSAHWHCNRRFVRSQLGCTLVPSWRIRHLVAQKIPKVRKSFDLVNRSPEALPWRCIFDCPTTCDPLDRFLPAANSVGKSDQLWWPVSPLFTAWPDRLFDETDARMTLASFDRLRDEISLAVEADPDKRHAAASYAEDGTEDDRLYPARLLIVDQRGGDDIASDA